MEVNKRLRVSGSRGHEVFFKPLVANERPRKVRASMKELAEDYTMMRYLLLIFVFQTNARVLP